MPKGRRSYFQWPEADEKIVIAYFKDAINDRSQRGSKGPLPG